LSKEECRQHVVKEAFKIDIVEVNERTTDKEKFVKIVQEIAKFNRQSAHQELLIQRLEAELRDLKELYNEHKRKFPNRFDLPHSPVEGNCGVEAKGGEECSVEGAVDGVVEGSVGGCVEGGVKGVEEGHVEGAKEGSVGGCVEGAVEGDVKGAEEGHVEGAKEGSVGGCVEGVVKGGVKGAEEGHVEGAKEGLVEIVVVDIA